MGTVLLGVAALCGHLGQQSSLAAVQPVTRVGAVRFLTPEDANSAVAKLDGREWRGQCLKLAPDMSDQLGNRIHVHGLNGLTRWQELREYLARVAEVAWVEICASDSFAELRFNTSFGAEQAVDTLQGTELCGSELLLQLAPGDRVLVHGVSHATKYRDLLKVFNDTGEVDFAYIHRASAEVRFESAESARLAVKELDGSQWKGRTIKVAPHHNTKDGTKVVVTVLAASFEWKDLKEYFGQVGRVEFLAFGQKGGYSNPR